MIGVGTRQRFGWQCEKYYHKNAAKERQDWYDKQGDDFRAPDDANRSG